ncbi:MAG: hypothetical protein ACKOSQ_04975 [Planctomycetaceae bacterium]
MPSPRSRAIRFILVRPFVAAMLVCVAPGADAEGPALPDATAHESVLVSGVVDSFAATRAAVARARETSGRDYRVVVVDSAGDAGDARGLLDRLTARWRTQAEGAFDPATDATIVLAVNERKLAMDVPWALEAAAGLDVPTLEQELIANTFVPRARDGLLDEGLAALVDGTERWVRERADEKLARAEADRVFRTRTLPLGLAAAAGTAALVFLAARRVRHARRLAAARAKLAAFKADVVALSDMLDAQQERHRMLPHADPDFTTPMEGLTRSAYDGVQEAIARYRERWLGLMDVWERAQAKVDSEWFLGTAAADEAVRLLESAEARPPLDEVAGACRGPLDALETAHEEARALRDSVAADAAAVTARVEGLAHRGRSGAPYQARLNATARGSARAVAVLEHDPVAARGTLEEAAATLAAAREHVEGVEAGDDRRQRALAQADGVAAQVAARRAEGWLLTEPGADPDDRLAAARHECGLAAQLLDAGDVPAATASVERAEQASAAAAALLESIIAARARVEELLPPAAARLDALAAGRAAAAAATAHLERTYAESSWSDVADNVARIDEGLARTKALLLEARAAGEPARQHYFRGVALVEEAGRQEDWVSGCQDALAERRARLDELRTSLPVHRDAVAGRVVELARQLDRQRTDRARANERCREAARLLETADAGLAAPQPELLQAEKLVAAADAAAARGADLAAEDDRLAQQAVREIEESGAVVRRAAAWYGEGVQADLRAARQMLDTAEAQLGRQRYEDAIKTAGEATLTAQAAYATATAEAERRRIRRQQEIQRRRMEDSFARSAGGAGPWVITLPGGRYSGPDPWRSVTQSAPPRSAGTSWSRDIAQVGW